MDAVTALGREPTRRRLLEWRLDVRCPAPVFRKDAGGAKPAASGAVEELHPVHPEEGIRRTIAVRSFDLRG